jgi:hypothetical protein
MRTRALSYPFKIKDTYIFSPLTDLIVFISPVVIGAIVILICSESPLRSYFSGFEHWINYNRFFSIYSVVVDIPHLYSTFFRAYSSPDIMKNWSNLVIIGPVIIFLLLIGFNQYPDQILLVMTYCAIFHGIRQQYGWLVYSTKRDEDKNKLDQILDGIVIYAITLPIVIWYHCHHWGEGWIGLGGKLIPIYNPLIGEIALLFQSFFITIYLIRQIYVFFVKKTFNLTKFVVVASTWVGWHFFLYWINPPYCGIGPAILHTLPYLYLFFFVFSKTKKEVSKKLNLQVAVYLAFICLALITNIAGSNSHRFNKFSILITAILGTLPFSHYLLDAYIWKTSSLKNREIISIFKFKRSEIC